MYIHAYKQKTDNVVTKDNLKTDSPLNYYNIFHLYSAFLINYGMFIKILKSAVA